MDRSEQKCRVTMEIMLHHNIATDKDVEEYSQHAIPEYIEGIEQWVILFKIKWIARLIMLLNR